MGQGGRSGSVLASMAATASLARSTARRKSPDWLAASAAQQQVDPVHVGHCPWVGDACQRLLALPWWWGSEPARGRRCRLRWHVPWPAQDPWAARIAGRVVLEGAPVVGVGAGDVESHGPIASKDQKPGGKLPEADRLLRGPGRPRQGERGRVVVGEHLGVVGDPLAGGPFDPGGGGAVLSHPGCPRKLGVGNVAGEHVPERRTRPAPRQKSRESGG